MANVSLLNCDAIAGLSSTAAQSIQTCVTSPPYYGLRDYGVAGQIGLESTPEAYVSRLVAVFREVRRVLKKDGTCWLNLGDSYAGSGPSGAAYQSKTTLARAGKKRDGAFAISHTLASRGLTYAEKKPVAPPGLKPKDIIGIPWRVAFALQADGWYLRQDIIWAKPNPMPESVRDRCTKAHEYVFLLAKSERYLYDADAVKERAITVGDTRHLRTDGRRARTGKPQAETRNRRSVWTITPKPYRGAHFAVMPEALVEPCILAGSRPGDLVLDPFAGSGTVGVVAQRLSRGFLGFEISADYCVLAESRLGNHYLPLAACQ